LNIKRKRCDVDQFIIKKGKIYMKSKLKITHIAGSLYLIFSIFGAIVYLGVGVSIQLL
jgi:hypothetical protein